MSLLHTMPETEVREWMGVVRAICHAFKRRLPPHVHWDDLESAGMYGLTIALRDYDPDIGVPFSTFCRMKVHGAITDDLRGSDFLGRGSRRLHTSMNTAFGELTHELHREPTLLELANKLDVTTEAVTTAVIHGTRGVSLDLSLDGGSTLGDFVPSSPIYPEPLGGLVWRELLGYLHDAIASLPSKEREAIWSHYFTDEQHEAVARRLKVTSSRVSQLVRQAEDTVRNAIFALLFPELVPNEQLSPCVTERRRRFVQSVAGRPGLQGLTKRLLLTNLWGVVLEPRAER